MKSQEIVWDRGRPARNAAQARGFFLTNMSRFALIAGGTPAVPDNLLKISANKMPDLYVKA